MFDEVFLIKSISTVTNYNCSSCLVNLVNSCNTDIKCIQIYEDESHFLAGVYRGDKKQDNRVALLFTVARGQKKPFCSLCSSKMCRCFRMLKQQITDDQDPNQTLEFYWNRRLHPQKEPQNEYNQHYINQFETYGYNLESIEYPIKVKHST